MRIVWLTIGWVAVALGAIGALLPVFPTVPFLILAVWAFSRSSARLRDRILHHPKFGPPIRAWKENGVISRLAKVWAISAMTVGVIWAIWLQLPPYILVPQAAVCSLVALYLVTRPEV